MDGVDPFFRFIRKFVLIRKFILILHLVYRATWSRTLGGEVVFPSTVAAGLAIGWALFLTQCVRVGAELAGLALGLRCGVARRSSSGGRTCWEFFLLGRQSCWGQLVDRFRGYGAVMLSGVFSCLGHVYALFEREVSLSGECCLD